MTLKKIAQTLKSNGITEFTISSTFSSLIETLAAFEKHGISMAGLTLLCQVVAGNFLLLFFMILLGFSTLLLPNIYFVLNKCYKSSKSVDE